MNQAVIKSLFKAIVYLSVLAMIFVAASDKEIFRRHFDGDSTFSLVDFVAEFWPMQIILAFVLIIAFIAIQSEKVEKFLRGLTVSGTVLIPVLILIYASILAGYIFASNITYPANVYDDSVMTAYFLLAGSVVYIPFLFTVNDGLSNPASPTTFITLSVLLFGFMFSGFGTWFNYIISGEIDLLYVPKLLF